MEIDGYDCFGAGSYPEPPEIKEKHVNGKLDLTFNIDIDVPKKWDSDMITSYIKENLKDCISIYDYSDIDIDLDYGEEHD